ncbi:hypothetical protein BDY24DRAFT_390627 [Mrakia frigida]|uniref:ubiquitin carboxyl-terminal hydrolase n=1 Tax=Mrakia frigida TaxID=29902 RepID=UPI003FCC0760
MSPSWIPLESSPEVFNSYAKSLGFPTTDSSFVDIWGLDADLLSFVPQPVKAVLLLFPTTKERSIRNKEAEKNGEIVLDSRKGEEGDVMWIPQTIGNACGTMGLLHALGNAGVEIPSDAPLYSFFDEARKVSPAARTELLSTSPLLARAHTSASSAGQTLLREEDHSTNLHFIAFVQGRGKDGSLRVVELDGNRAGPIDLGPCTDLLSDVARIVKEDYMASDPTSDSFSLMALAPTQDQD